MGGEQIGAFRVWTRDGYGADAVVRVIARANQGGQWHYQGALDDDTECVVQGFGRKRNAAKRLWTVAGQLLDNGIAIAEPIAFAELRRVGLLQGTWYVSKPAADAYNVDTFARRMIGQGAGADRLLHFFFNLGTAINKLLTARVYHASLCAEHIHTQNGAEFVFSGLDLMQPDIAYTDARRLENLVQLYDSFCDLAGDPILVPFMRQLLAPQHDPRVWMPRIREGQRTHRAKAEEDARRSRRR